MLIIAFQKKKKLKSGGKNEVFLSVVIPVRDEAELSELIRDLLDQSLSVSSYEIIVINDHSTEIPAVPDNVTLLSLKGGETGKKIALTKGINTAKGNIIVTIDGDCRVGSSFLSDIYELFKENDVVLSPGLVEYKPADTIFKRFQATELYAIMGSGIALNSIGFTSLSNGANLTFQKEVWKEVGGYQQHKGIPSGDDEFFVQAVAEKYADKIFFRRAPESVVSTKSNENFLQFFNQRIRWAGKWKSYQDKRMTIVAALIFLFHIGICAAIIQLFATGDEKLLVLFGIKIFLEAVFILNVAWTMKSRFYLFSFALLQFLYSPYVVFFGLTANFVSYSWKGRRFRY